MYQWTVGEVVQRKIVYQWRLRVCTEEDYVGAEWWEEDYVPVGEVVGNLTGQTLTHIIRVTYRSRSISIINCYVNIHVMCTIHYFSNSNCNLYQSLFSGMVNGKD